ncbi:MAG TPA: nuclear transport factor 2 family protein [Thermoleophilaceae bacterium]|nr:nuclear transport factor 2 family protein [Thermoleophilaceae bacterium]
MSVSAANPELARSVLDAWNAGDVEAIAALCHPEYELRTSGVYPGLKPVYHGRAGFREFWWDWAELWEGLILDVEELWAEGERVLALLTFRARGRDGVEVHRPAASLSVARDGLVFRQSMFGSWEEGRQAADLDD